MGDGAEDGSVRRLVMEQLQGLQKAVLEKSLEDRPDQAARPVIHVKQLDKISSGWVNALPGPDSYIPTPAFSETMCPAQPARTTRASRLARRRWTSGGIRSSRPPCLGTCTVG